MSNNQVWSASKHDEIIKRLMNDIGQPNSQSVYGAFKQFANELHALSVAAPETNMPDDEAMLRMSANEAACYRWPMDTVEHRAMRAAYMDGAASVPQRTAMTASAVPVAWVIPGDDTARDDGFIDAMVMQEGEFSRPLYAAPPSPDTVRDLDWQETTVDRGDGFMEPNGWEADNGFGSWYAIEMGFASDSYCWTVFFDGTLVADSDDPEAAKTKAQNHFAERILSALSRPRNERGGTNV